MVFYRLHHSKMDVFSHVSYHLDRLSLLRACSSCPNCLAPGWHQQCAVHVRLCCSLEAQIQDSEKLPSRDCFGVSKLLDSQIRLLWTCCKLTSKHEYNFNIMNATFNPPPCLSWIIGRWICRHPSDCSRIQKKHKFKSKTITSGPKPLNPLNLRV